jgi:serine/threonine protein kinase/tetratricopeptide (TPR) repeat protein
MTERDVFIAALQKDDPEQRRAYLDEACAGRPGLLAEVEELLRLHENAGSFLERQAVPEATALFTPSPGDAGLVERPGTVIGAYKLLEQIGAGGFGVVFMAEQREPIRRKVALKVLKPGMDSGQVIARFEAERQALALMDHPNIARVLDGGTTASGRPYFVMELVKGLALTAFCDQQRLRTDERLRLFADVCAAVQHAHQKGIIHRDLKPSNVLVTLHDGQPVVKVIDFGIAKASGQHLTERTLFTGFAQMIGTPLYMSPEQAALNGLDVDTRSDIYSLGVLLYELLTGTTPFDAERLRTVGYDEMRRIIREERPPKPSTRISTMGQAAATVWAQRQSDPKRLSQLVRGELDWVVMKALEKDRNRRYESASAFAADVLHYLHDEPVLACPPSASYRLGKFVRRNKGPVVAVSVFVLLLVAGILGTTTSLVQALAAKRVTLKERDEKDKALSQAVTDRDEKEKALRQAVRDRRQTRHVLNMTTDAVLEDPLGRQIQLTDQHRQFLKKVLAEHAAFAAAAAEGQEGRQGQADAYFRVGRFRWLLGELKEAEPAYRAAVALQEKLVADFPARSDFQQELSRSHHNLGNLLANTGRPKEAEAAYRAAVALQKQLVGRFPQQANFRRSLALSQHNLGSLLSGQKRHREAKKALDKALAMRKQLADDSPNQPELQCDLAFTHNSLGILLANARRPKEAAAAYGKALAIRQQLAGAFPTRPDYRQELGHTHNGLGLLLVDQKNYTEAKKHYEVALALHKRLADDFPMVPEFQNNLAGRLLNIAILHNHRQEYATAVSIVEQARPHIQAALRANPKSPNARQCALGLLRALAWSQHGQADHARLAATANELARSGYDPPNDTCHAARYLGLCVELANKDAQLAEARRRELTKGYADKALELLRQAAARVGKDATGPPPYHQPIASCYLELGGLLSAFNRPKEAESAYRAAVALLKQLVKDFPNRPALRSALGQGHHDLGVLLDATRRPNAAAAAYRDALAIREQLVKDFPRRRDFRHALFRSRHNLGNVMYTTGRPKEAEAAYRAALALQKKLVAELPTVAEYQNDLAGTLVNLAMVHNQRREFAAALPFLEQARPHHQAALKASPRSPTYRQFYRNNLETRAQSQQGLADHARLAPAADELARFGYDPANDTYLAACFLARCVTLAGKDAQLDEARRKELAKDYADRALTLLQQAVARGFKNIAQLKREPDLQPLRAREDFTKLLAKLEGKATE